MSSSFFAGQTNYLSQLNQLADQQCYRNLIINGEFRWWQRAITGTPAVPGTYLADRFKSFSDGTGTSAVSQQAFAVGSGLTQGEPRYHLRHLRSVAAAASNTLVAQYIEDGTRMTAGKQIAFSFWAKAAVNKTFTMGITQDFGTGGSPSAGVAVTQNISVTTAWARYTFTTTLGTLSGKTFGTNDDTSLIVSVQELTPFTTFTFDTWGWQVELGGIVSDFQIMPPDESLKRCQRFFEKSWDPDTVAATTLTNGQQKFVSRVADQLDRAAVRYSVSKRRVPQAADVAVASPVTGTANRLRNLTGAADITCSVEDLGISGFTVLPTVNTVVSNQYSFHWQATAEY